MIEPMDLYHFHTPKAASPRGEVDHICFHNFTTSYPPENFSGCNTDRMRSTSVTDPGFYAVILAVKNLPYQQIPVSQKPAFKTQICCESTQGFVSEQVSFQE